MIENIKRSSMKKKIQKNERMKDIKMMKSEKIDVAKDEIDKQKGRKIKIN